MSREVLVDASAWIAVSDKRDIYHQAARAEFTRLNKERITLVTTNLIIAETYILIHRMGGHAQAMCFLGSKRANPSLMRVWSDGELEELGEEILQKHIDQDYSYADAVSYAMMQERGIEEAFTFDRHFTTMGFRIIPAVSGGSS